MTDLNKLRRLAGVPVDLSNVDNARGTIVVPARLQKPISTLKEAAKVPAHRGELSPKTKKNMRQRVSCAKKALEALELARDELMSLPAIDYMEDIPDVIRQLHKMLHGEDGTGGLHSHARQFEREYNDMEFPEDLENTEPGEDGNPTEEEIKAKEKEKAKKAKEKAGEKKPVKEGQAVDKMLQGKNALANSVQSTAGQMEGERSNNSDDNSEQEENTEEDESFGLSLGSRYPNRQAKIIGSHSDSDAGINPEAVKAAKEAGVAKKELEKNPFGEEEEGSYACDTCDSKGQVINRANGKVEDCHTCMGRGHIPHDEVDDDMDDEEDCAMSMPMGESKKPKWLEKAEVEAEEREGKHVSDAEKKKVDEAAKAKKPKWLEKAEVKAELKSGEKVSKKEEKKVGVKEAARVVFDMGKNKDWIKPGSDLDKKFAADAKNDNSAAHMATEEEPVNVAKSKQGNLFYPKATHDEGPNQIQTNPYNESQKVHVPATIKSALKAEAEAAQKNADMFMSRKDLDSKNFYEDMAKAFNELHMKLDEGTLYSIKEAQILMTSMMNIFTSKIPPDVVKFIAAGGTVRPLKDYMKKVTGNFDEWHITPSK